MLKWFQPPFEPNYTLSFAGWIELGACEWNIHICYSIWTFRLVLIFVFLAFAFFLVETCVNWILTFIWIIISNNLFGGVNGNMNTIRVNAWWEVKLTIHFFRFYCNSHHTPIDSLDLLRWELFSLIFFNKILHAIILFAFYFTIDFGLNFNKIKTGSIAPVSSVQFSFAKNVTFVYRWNTVRLRCHRNSVTITNLILCPWLLSHQSLSKVAFHRYRCSFPISVVCARNCIWLLNSNYTHARALTDNKYGGYVAAATTTTTSSFPFSLASMSHTHKVMFEIVWKWQTKTFEIFYWRPF